MPCIHNEQMIQTLRTDRPHESLGVGIRVRRPERGFQDLRTFRPKDLVETGHVLGVAIADEELGLDFLVDNVTGHIPGLLGDP